MNKIAYYRNDKTGELAPPHRIGENDSGKPLYHAPTGWTPVDSSEIAVPVVCDEDGNWTPINCYDFAELVESALREMDRADSIPSGGLGHWVAQAWPLDDGDIDPDSWAQAWLETIATVEVS